MESKKEKKKKETDVSKDLLTFDQNYNANVVSAEQKMYIGIPRDQQGLAVQFQDLQQ